MTITVELGAPEAVFPGDAGPALSWRLVSDVHEPASGSRNMALDHALAVSAVDGSAMLRLYRWARPTVSFGRNEPGSRRYATHPSHGIDFVRRPTGGRAVLHDDELTYAVVLPVRAFGGARASYRAVNACLAAALRSLGVDADVSSDGPIRAPDAGPCFRSPTSGEVVADGRKLVGSAQVKLGRVILQHGSILLGGDQRRLDELRSERPSGDPTATLLELVGPVRVEEVVEALVRSMQTDFGGAWRMDTYEPEELETADRLERERYASDTWTWRR